MTPFLMRQWDAFKRRTILRVTSNQLILLVCVFFAIFGNNSFYAAVLSSYPLTVDNAFFLATIAISFTALTAAVVSLFCYRYTIKPVLIGLIIVAALSAYFMDSYNVMIDDSMIQNVLETNVDEAGDLLSLGLVIHLLVLGVLPALVVARAQIVFRPLLKQLVSRVAFIVGLLAMTLSLLFVNSAASASFFREHKSVRYYSNPGNYIIAVTRLGRNYWRQMQDPKPFIHLGEDAYVPIDDTGRDLVIVVVGETARADRFSLNGYARKTNPMLEKQDVVSFTHVESCATLTAISVPCMFSVSPADDLDLDIAKRTDNALDVLKRAGAHILWRDNNSSSKGVADRVAYEDYRDPANNTVCDGECRDVGMLSGLDDYINAHPDGDILIVLHQMGNHGPAYYKRYPQAFEIFKPACLTNELADCSQSEIDNAYDNAITYTDYFLNQVIEFLKPFDDRFETSMLYVSDHGESLGESGIYLHGMPNFVAPEAQRHVPMIVWFGRGHEDLNLQEIRRMKDRPFSHDNLFHTVLGLLEVETGVYDENLDMFRHLD